MLYQWSIPMLPRNSSYSENPMLRNIFALFPSILLLFLPFKKDPSVSLLLLLFIIPHAALFPGYFWCCYFFTKTIIQNNPCAHSSKILTLKICKIETNINIQLGNCLEKLRKLGVLPLFLPLSAPVFSHSRKRMSTLSWIPLIRSWMLCFGLHDLIISKW